MSALTALALADMMRQAQSDPEFRKLLAERGIPFGALASALEKADAACAEREAARQDAEHVRGALRSMERDYKTQVAALAARVERLEARNADMVKALEDAQRELALLNRNRDSAQADPERALIAIRAALSPQAEKEPTPC